MAILVIYDGPGVEKTQYEAVRKEVDWENRHPAGFIFQAAGFDKVGMRISDAWESQRAFDDFLAQRLKPALQKLQIAAPRMEVFPIHNLKAFPGVDQFKIRSSR